MNRDSDSYLFSLRKTIYVRSLFTAIFVYASNIRATYTRDIGNTDVV